nr:immunoglobulin light chain junction region [Macaca mulatta]MOW68221.1 immunoglobulin light chain junction region [Macaca mulatta]MOW71856.1 immunoglobulin light chain junction region [Macaca mulatta]
DYYCAIWPVNTWVF